MSVHKEVLERICENEPCSEKYCLLKEMILHDSKVNPRFLIQLKLVEIYKWRRGQELNQDIGFQKAWEEWVEKNYATRFAEVYDEFKSIKHLYQEIVG